MHTALRFLACLLITVTSATALAQQPNPCAYGPHRPAPALETPRIMYWYGKVNQHVDASGVWQTDPDGVSGADIDMLTYCRRWYPETRAVVPYRRETITTWRERGNVNAHEAEQLSYWCVPRGGHKPRAHR